MSVYNYAVALITATDTEAMVLKHIYDDWQEVRFENDEQLYYESSFEKDGKRYKVITAQQNEMGMTAAAVLSMKLISHFRPRYLIMVGIAAGVALENIEEQIYGDVIVPDIIWNYSAGKFVSAENSDIRFGEVGFIPRPTSVNADEDIIGFVENAASSSENQCHVYIGPMASGSAVVASSEILNKQIRTQFQHTAGLDMEAYAVVYAAENATSPKPKALVIKSVCDFADSRKSDKYQKLAAYTSSEFAKLLYEKFLPLD
ncbi:MAG: hypothetical protein ACI4QR_02080 [Eubacteriales bacterium]